MAQDPYGYTDSATGGGDLSADARMAMWLGIAATTLGSVGVCFCYVPYVIALPLGVMALMRGWRVYNTAKLESPERQMASAGLVAGAMSTGVSAMFVLFLIVYICFIVLYFGVIIAAIGAGAASGGSSY
mgnify:FL=1|jgi:hypothetical protein